MLYNRHFLMPLSKDTIKNLLDVMQKVSPVNHGGFYWVIVDLRAFA
jgi:hypothetical protein